MVKTGHLTVYRVVFPGIAIFRWLAPKMISVCFKMKILYPAKQGALPEIVFKILAIILFGGIAPIALSEGDIEFEKKYDVEYLILGDSEHEPEECIHQYNKIVFDYLDHKFGKNWRNEVRSR